MKKYALTNEKIEHNGHKLYRIIALRSFDCVHVGERGGFIESEYNLSQEDNYAWVSGDAKVYGNAVVDDDAMVYGNVEVYDNALVCHRAQITGYAKVFGNSKICRDGLVDGNATVYGEAVISGDAFVKGNARVFGYARVNGYAIIDGNSVISGGGNLSFGYYDEAVIKGSQDYLIVSPLEPNEIEYAAFYKTEDEKIRVSTPKFIGTITEFESRVQEANIPLERKNIILEKISTVRQLFFPED